eukprot:Skav232315  [mRNA]  locus=scaffold882:767277:767810:+ [translate_table: standard]
MSNNTLVQGGQAPVSVLSWRSSKIDRTCRSPGASETKAAVECEDDLFFVRILWSELSGTPLVLHDPEETARQSKAILVSDSRNFYDKVSKPVMTIKGAEKRSDVEALIVKESCERNGLTLRWVHSDAQLGNSLTKHQEKHQFAMFRRMNYTWKIVHDPLMSSAKVRKKQGMEAMDDR